MIEQSKVKGGPRKLGPCGLNPSMSSQLSHIMYELVMDEFECNSCKM